MSTAAIKTARRVFEVLEYFDEVKRPLTLREVSAHFGYPVSSTAALLKSLLQLVRGTTARAWQRRHIPTLERTGQRRQHARQILISQQAEHRNTRALALLSQGFGQKGCRMRVVPHVQQQAAASRPPARPTA